MTLASCLTDRDLLFIDDSISGGTLDLQLIQMGRVKVENTAGRNTWQGGIDQEDYGSRYEKLVRAGRKNYRNKWGTHKCDVAADPLTVLQRLGQLLHLH